MPDTLPVHVNRQELHALEVPTDFQTTGEFDVRISNHGEALHIHLHIDDALSEIATLDATNHYVKAESERLVRVRVAEDGPQPVRGSLKVVSSYGAQTRYIDVEISEPAESEQPVQVDERLSKPQPATERDNGSSIVEGRSVPILALGGIAFVIAGLVVALVDSLAVVLGSLAVVATVVVALAVALRE